VSSSNPYLRRPAAPASSSGPDGLADVLERVLDKGLVIAGDIQINLLDIELITIKVRLLLASADTAQQMGIDWWKHDPFLSGRDRELAQENAVLRERVDQLEAAVGAKLAPGEPSPGDLVGEGAGDLGPTRGQPIPTGALTGRATASTDAGTDETDETGGTDGTGAAPRSEEAEEVVLAPVDERATLRVEEGDDRVRVTAERDLDRLTKAELQDELRELDLPVSGSKAELVDRLRSHERA
jgi:hypothetical protein